MSINDSFMKWHKITKALNTGKAPNTKLIEMTFCQSLICDITIDYTYILSAFWRAVNRL